MSIAKQLVKVLPGEWFAYTDGDYSVWPTDGCAPEWEAIALCGEEESPWFINWALDELAKRDCGLDFDMTEDGVVWFCTWPHAERIGDGVVVRTQETPKCRRKTLALAHALIALGEHDG